jgi:hypothetical protein
MVKYELIVLLEFIYIKFYTTVNCLISQSLLTIVIPSKVPA